MVAVVNKNELVAALAEARKTFKPIEKNRTNPFHKNKYADLDAVLEGVNESLAANKLEILGPMEVTESGLAVLVAKLVHYPSGQEEISRYPLPKTDDPQKMGSAITYGRRYVITSLLNVVADADDDGNAAMLPPSTKPPAKTTAKPAPKPAPKADEDPDNPEMGQEGYESLLARLKAVCQEHGRDDVLGQIYEKQGLELRADFRPMEHAEAYILKCALMKHGVKFDKVNRTATGVTMDLVDSFALLFEECSV